MTTPTWDELDARPCPQWFQRAKFGVFIHWGVYSVPAWRSLSNERFGSYAEWYYASVYGHYHNADGPFHKDHYGDADYRDFAPRFTAELFDPDRWADLFARAGARYVVLTAKHHDGYCLWPTANPYKRGWNTGDTGPGRDLVGELASAVRRRGMRMGLYYSIIEWETHTSHRCGGGHFIPEADAARYGIDPAVYPVEVLEEQWKDLNTRYAPSVIYTDGGEWDCDEEYVRTRELLGWLYSQAPNRDEVVVNDRMHVGMPGVHGDYFSTEYQDVEGFGAVHPWEESRGIGGSYGFNRAENIEDYATAPELVALLARTVSGGGNLLLNVGPTADGRIDVLQQERLTQIGAWMDDYGGAIYDTRPVAGWRAPEGVHLTADPGGARVNVIVEAGVGGIVLGTAGARVASATDMATGEGLGVEVNGEAVRLAPPRARADGCPAVVRLALMRPTDQGTTDPGRTRETP
ncbi:alpha-L-fucosidase [Schaalia georgiae F0490]|uniref:alpha-L-fucosidase n=1 Tax=Schaalia georgiae F0490 TaxID=1125717 RepID=J0XC11_9ACTO|nr:alpha-L-fucosidase [Schaalia georgiae]EJF46196.1 alpha-L-fucosidase [Schaalia georgiae F0490]